MTTRATYDITAVADDQWDVVAWLWQAFRHDLATLVGGLPYADGRYQHAPLDAFPHPGGAGYLVWTPHPNVPEPAPVGFALVEGLLAERRQLTAFWVSPVLRRTGLGLQLARDVLGRHPGPWAIPFQRDNVGAGAFWRRVAGTVLGVEGRDWTEEARAVPGRPGVPPDHWIETAPRERVGR